MGSHPLGNPRVRSLGRARASTDARSRGDHSRCPRRDAASGGAALDRGARPRLVDHRPDCRGARLPRVSPPPSDRFRLHGGVAQAVHPHLFPGLIGCVRRASRPLACRNPRRDHVLRRRSTGVERSRTPSSRTLSPTRCSQCMCWPPATGHFGEPPRVSRSLALPPSGLVSGSAYLKRQRITY